MYKKLIFVIAIQVAFVGTETYASCGTEKAQTMENSVHCGSTPSATLDSEGRLWVAFVQNEFVYVSQSNDLGKSYSDPVAVNSVAEDAEHNGENRPKIIVDESGTIFVSWTLKTSPRFTGEIRFSRSIDNGKSFEAPRTINDDNLFTGHRFETLFLSESGHLYLTWIDKRDLEAKLEKGEEYIGAAVYYAVSDDKGASFSKNYRVANNSCECCRIAIAPKGPENIAILWRQVFGEDVRDHAIAELTPTGETLVTNRASFDEWHINACPHHGPTMALSSLSGDYHMSWFTNGDVNQGIYYARYSFDEQKSNSLFQVDGQPGAGHPYLAEFDQKLYLVWKGFNGKETLLNLITSSDDGISWSSPKTLLITDKGSDHPLLIKDTESLYLSWLSDEFGYIFLKLNDNTRQLSNNGN
ncbi:MAG: sialidase family protein [Gammaproteobacteria bacterium]|nr:sialidase family protein [Gammaproteobacteria bacterium]